MSDSSIIVVVPKEVGEFFRRAAIHGQGGFQALCRDISKQLQRSDTLRMEPTEFRRIVRYATHYGEGGYQQRLRKIITNWVSQNFNSIIPE